MSNILEKKNIILNCKPKEKEAVIREMGQLLVDSGYAESAYVDAMVAKEEVFNTNIGNSIAIPHGIESAKKHIMDSGIAIMTFPDGTDWGNGEKVKVVIGIAANGDTHMDILSKIAISLSEPEEVENLMTSSVEDIYHLFTEA